MARFCASCGAQMADNAAACPACGKAAAAGGGGAAPAASGGLTDNVAGALCYIAIIAIIFLLIEPYNRNKYVRFHAFQAIFLAIAGFVGSFVLGFIPILGWILLPFWSLGILIVAIVSAVKAYGNQKWKLPMIGDMAEKQANA
ncbi:MAG: DUF4870 domain-containing protein [Terriglobales bacterium]